MSINTFRVSKFTFRAKTISKDWTNRLVSGFSAFERVSYRCSRGLWNLYKFTGFPGLSSEGMGSREANAMR
jgi:hypothetical protein